ncbi:MAG: hypothetical protein QF486_00750 [Candidatus Woesearchaeota archaeon]|jgi:tetratricopeptide (TPR) repeat protein|nr:hypothetical protein [Candidatus Woesearchaeota archaeon]MDP7198130.1 hypothetical protein [Candidatus Woesearchaeota archaeon]MDP7466964.1 hypothetical protein [Candidatus Woesearchaeota archaeon]|tara:strand:+ start:767 stop:1330 length:564 start_codon:yes stop_codon:yes gene_type:complete
MQALSRKQVISFYYGLVADNTLDKKGMFSKAEGFSKKALELGPKMLGNKFIQVNILYRKFMKDIAVREEIINAYRESLALDPGLADPRMPLMNLYLSHLLTYRMEPKNSKKITFEDMKKRGAQESVRKEFMEAKQSLWKYLSFKPKRDLWRELYFIESILGDEQKAAVALRRAKGANMANNHFYVPE